MARPLRIEFDGALYHVTSRGNARAPVFITDTNRVLFLDILKKTCDRFNWLCHAYCLMDNHYHLVIETPDGNLSKGMRQLNGVYTQSFNKRNQRVGHVFQGRYKAIVIEKRAISCRFQDMWYLILSERRLWKVLLNGSGAVIGGTAGIGKPHTVLTIDWILKQFDKHREKARKSYKEFVMSGIRGESIWEGVKGAESSGKRRFCKEIDQVYKRARRDRRNSKTSEIRWKTLSRNIYSIRRQELIDEKET